MQNPASIEEKRKPENKNSKEWPTSKEAKNEQDPGRGNTETKTRKIWSQREESLGFVAYARLY
jgi:hypothetical protein